MAFCRFLFPLLVLSVISCNGANVPVYMWGNTVSSSKANPLTLTSSEEFKSILKTVTSGTPTIVFIESLLSVEDLSSRNEDGKTAYPYLHGNIKESLYLPSVENPVDVLAELAGDSATKIDLTENSLSKELPTTANDNIIFINLNDAKEGETRFELLKRHDEFIEKTVAQAQEDYGEVMAIYTAKYPSWTITTHSRVRRAATVRDSSLALDGVRLYAKSISLLSRNDTTVLASILSNSTVFNETELYAKLSYENETSITLNFYKKGGYWFFNSVTLSTASLTENLTPVGEEVFAIEGFSYRCAQHVKFASTNESRDYTLDFENLKIQPFFDGANSTQEFGDSFNCVGFFTAPIWAGLFIVFILLAITFYGIMMMMDIRTMDRFDDPKGKTITINTAE